jgi:hypothetical protein
MRRRPTLARVICWPINEVNESSGLLLERFEVGHHAVGWERFGHLGKHPFARRRES